MRHRITALAGAVVAGAVLHTLAPATPAAADVPGFRLRVTAPDRFTAAQSAQTVTAVVTSESRQCRKVRWVLVVRTAVDAEQLQVTRVEEAGEFDTSTVTDGDTITIVDEALDPGTLCRGRTVTGRWQISFDGPDGGDVRFEARAFDQQETLLTTAAVSATIDGEQIDGEQIDEEQDADPSEDESSESAEPSESPAAEDEEAVEDDGSGAGDGTGEGTAGAVIGAPAGDETETALVADQTSLLGPGLIVGGICVFLGVLLLLRLRTRARTEGVPVDEPTMPTGFYGMPPRR